MAPNRAKQIVERGPGIREGYTNATRRPAQRRGSHPGRCSRGTALMASGRLGPVSSVSWTTPTPTQRQQIPRTGQLTLRSLVFP